MTLMTPPLYQPERELVPRPAETRLRELGNDLAAVWSSAPAVDSWMARPSILRRVATELSLRLAPDTDRIVALGPGSLVLGGALSLTTGLSFCAVESDGRVFGAVHPGERVAVISVDGGTLEPEWLSTMVVSRRLSVISHDALGDEMIPGDVLSGQREDDGVQVLISQLPLRHDRVAPQPKGDN